MVINTYDVGKQLRITGTFVALSGPIDPDTVKFSFKTPAGVVTTYTFATHPQVVKTGTGVYYCDIDLDLPGRYYYRFFSLGNGKAAEEHECSVKWTRVA